MTRQQLLDEHMRVCKMISDPSVSDAEVRQAMEAFERLDAPAAAIAESLASMRLTMEQRSPGHQPGRG